QWADAIKAGKSPDTIPFDPSKVKITHVFGSGQLTFLKLVADGMDPMQANDSVNAFSDYFGNKYIGTDPHAQTTIFKRLQLAPKQTMFQMPKLVTQPIADAIRSPETSRLGRWTAPIRNNAVGAGAGALSYTVGDLLGLHRVQQDMLEQ
ncbi:MAG: hypothetical protein ACRD3W_00605, partial [Terriglobales bacterium]